MGFAVFRIPLDELLEETDHGGEEPGDADEELERLRIVLAMNAKNVLVKAGILVCSRNDLLGLIVSVIGGYFLDEVSEKIDEVFGEIMQNEES